MRTSNSFHCSSVCIFSNNPFLYIYFFNERLKFNLKIFFFFFFFFIVRCPRIHQPVWQGNPYDTGTQGTSYKIKENKRVTTQTEQHKAPPPQQTYQPTPHNSRSNQAKKSSTRSPVLTRPPSSYSYAHLDRSSRPNHCDQSHPRPTTVPTHSKTR